MRPSLRDDRRNIYAKATGWSPDNRSRSGWGGLLMRRRLKRIPIETRAEPSRIIAHLEENCSFSSSICPLLAPRIILAQAEALVKMKSCTRHVVTLGPLTPVGFTSLPATRCLPTATSFNDGYKIPSNIQRARACSFSAECTHPNSGCRQERLWYSTSSGCYRFHKRSPHHH